MTRSKSRRTRRNRRRRGGKKKPIAPNTPPFAGAEGWITANNHLTDLTTPGGCAMMLGKRGTLYGRSGWGGEYGKIAASKMNGYDGKTNNKLAMMNFNLGCDKGNGENQVILANERMDVATRNKYGITNEFIKKKDLLKLFKSFDWATRKKFLEEGTKNMSENEKFKNFAVAAAPPGAAGLKNQYVREDHGNATPGGGSRRRRRKKSRRKRKKSRRKRKKSRKRRRRR
tara:strand:- start:6145 stop:6828 length:684 start_codon:yes stop_codon:yes gene_type:complete